MSRLTREEWLQLLGTLAVFALFFGAVAMTPFCLPGGAQ